MKKAFLFVSLALVLFVSSFVVSYMIMSALSPEKQNLLLLNRNRFPMTVR